MCEWYITEWIRDCMMYTQVTLYVILLMTYAHKITEMFEDIKRVIWNQRSTGTRLMFVHGPSQNMDLQRFLSYFVVRCRFAAIDWIIGYFFYDFWCFNATFRNSSALSWRPVLLVEEAEVPGENHRPWVSNW
jgi:hypothetical protein